MKKLFKKLTPSFLQKKKSTKPTINKILLPEKGKALLIMGGAATGKTLLAKQLAESIGPYLTETFANRNPGIIRKSIRGEYETIIFEEVELNSHNLSSMKSLVTKHSVRFIFCAAPAECLPPEVNLRRFKTINL